MTEPSTRLSATIAAFSCADHLRRRSTPVITSIRRGPAVADTSLLSSLRSTLWSKRCLLMGRHHARRLRLPEGGGRTPLTLSQRHIIKIYISILFIITMSLVFLFAFLLADRSHADCWIFVHSAMARKSEYCQAEA